MAKQNKTIQIKNMCCRRCILMVTDILEKRSLHVQSVRLGKAVFTGNIDYKLLDNDLKLIGFERIIDPEIILTETIRNTLFEFINNIEEHTENNSNLIKLVEHKTKITFRQANLVFIKHRNTTIEKYFILLKIEKVKALIEEGQLNFNEIAEKLEYKAYQHLAAQFKKNTSKTMSSFKKSNHKNRKPFDEI
ncbi:MAG: helix-turn-helix transcriptional regulator [Bacteroidia bacterium]|nr:helix-turn-helix transcriptional regulator [Bacteroidia bacterium]